MVLIYLITYNFKVIAKVQYPCSPVRHLSLNAGLRLLNSRNDINTSSDLYRGDRNRQKSSHRVILILR